MKKTFSALLMIAALLFCCAGVLADDSSPGSDDSADSGADDSSDDSSDDSTDDSSSDSTDDSFDTSPTHDDSVDAGADDSPDSADDGMDDSTGDSVDNSIDDSMDNSADDSPDAAEQEMETEIEHGIKTIMTAEGERLNAADPSPGDGVISVDSRTQSAIMARSLVSLSSLPGPDTSRIAELAGTVDSSFEHFSEAERSIRDRSGLITFFFGGDDDAAYDIESHVNEDSTALSEMERLANDPSVSPQVKAFTQARVRIIQSELARMQALAAAEKQKRGLFG